MGPVIKAEVGEEIEIVFKNMASKPYSMHAHLIKTDKANEGTLYSDDANTQSDDEVQPGGMIVYTWHVSNGPGPKDPACISSIYYSAHDEVRDLLSGLVGPIIICKKGVLDESGRRNDVDKEFSVLFAIFDENESLYLNDNIHFFAPSRNTSNLKERAFVESNLMHAINGYIYQAVPGLTMTVGEKIAWYILGFGSSEDLHTVHFHGQTVLNEHSGQHTQDVLDIFPESGTTTEMLAINPGIWLLHCHVDDHMAAGMETIYTILPKGSQAFIANVTVQWDGKKIERIGERIIVEESFPTDKTVDEPFRIISLTGNGTKGNAAPTGRFDDATKEDNSKILFLKNIINNTLLHKVNSKPYESNLTQINDNKSILSPKRYETQFVSDEKKPQEIDIDSNMYNQSFVQPTSKVQYVSDFTYVDYDSDYGISTPGILVNNTLQSKDILVKTINLPLKEISLNKTINTSTRNVIATERSNLPSKDIMVRERTKSPAAHSTMKAVDSSDKKDGAILVESGVVNFTLVTNSTQEKEPFVPPM